MQDHDDRHGQGNDVEEAGCALEYDGICELDIAGEAVCLNPDTAGDGSHGADGST